MSAGGLTGRAAAAALLAFVLTLPLQAQQPAGKTYPLGHLAGTRLSVEARINGIPVTALLDSGAEATLIDFEFARQIKLPQGTDVTARGSGEGTQKARLVPGVTLEAIGITLQNQTVGVLDLSDVGKRLLGGPLNVVLGREMFDAAAFVIDIEGKTIRVRGAGEQPRGVRLALESDRGIETVPVRVEGGPEIRAIFDLGNGSNVMVSGEYAKRSGLLDGRPVSTRSGGGLGGETQRQVITLASLEIAGRRFENVPADIDLKPGAPEANVGISILRHFIVTTDYRGRAVWLGPR